MLTPADEYFDHQVALPHAMVGSSDQSWRERYWLSIQDIASRDTVLSVGLGKYPNTDTAEGAAVFARSDNQHNVRVARELGVGTDPMHVGPLRVDVIEPFSELRVTLDENPSGLAFELTWTGLGAPMLEERHYWVRRQRATYDAIRYVQHGRASGLIQLDGEAIEVTPDAWWGQRDHSWGTRPLPRRTGDAPGVRPDWNLLFFAPLRLPSRGIHLYLYESEPGRPVHLSGAVTPRFDEDGPIERIVEINHDLRWERGARAPTLQGGSIDLVLDGGETMHLDLKAHPGRAHLRGLGYEGWDGWFQGLWKGTESIVHECWDLTDESQIYRYGKSGSDHLVEVTHEGETGWGVMQYVVLPGHPTYGYAVPPKPVRDRR